MAKGIILRAFGDYACFTRPEMKAERVSYEVITPSAARAIIEAVYWKPEITWIVDKIEILKPIHFMNIRRNEIGVPGKSGSKINFRSIKSMMKKGLVDSLFFADDSKNRQQRAAMILKEVDYLIHAHFELESGEKNEAKHIDTIRRRLKKGKCFKQPYFGNREFSAFFDYVENPTKFKPIDLTKDLGYMLYDIDFENDMKPLFFRAQINEGILEIPDPNSKEVIG